MEQAESSSEQPGCSLKQTEHEQTQIPSEIRSSEQTERSEPTSEHVECSSEQAGCSKQTERSEPTSEHVECSSEQAGCSKQTERSEPTSEHVECSSEQAGCSKQTERSEPTSEHVECSSEQAGRSKQTERSVPTSEHVECSSELAGRSKQMEPSEPTSEHVECSSEQAGCSKQTECSGEETASAEPPKDAEPGMAVWSDEWLLGFAEQLARVPPLWRAAHHMTQCKPKSARGFAYLRLLSAVEPRAEGDAATRIAGAMGLCRDFYKLLRQKMRAAAAECRGAGAGPDEALRRCPAWARRADSYLNHMPLVFAHLNAVHNDKQNKKRVPAPRRPPPPIMESVAGLKLMRRVVRGMRRAAAQHGGPTRAAAAAAAAAALGDTEERVFALWCGMRKLSMFKLRALLARGDAPSDSGRLDALDWAIADLLILYGITLVGHASYQNYEQLSALLGTFHLVQRFQLERPGQDVAPSEWVEAARWYSRNRVQMSALGLQKRWCELKLDTRRRFLARLHKGPAAPAPLPLHEAIARRYEHVVTKSPPWWKKLVTEGKVAAPTSTRGPAPGEPDTARSRRGDDSSDSDTAKAAAEDDDDDLTIVEKTLETIDLSDDKNDEDTSEIDTKAPSATQAESQVSKPSSTLLATALTSKKRTPKDSNPKKTKVSRKFDKTIDVNKEIVDLDAPSPKADVLEALKELDVSNVQTTILFDSDEDDIKCIDDASGDKTDAGCTDGVNEVNNESHSDKNRRESTDSEDGNLVIDCESDNTCTDVRNTDTHNAIWKAIEREMLPPPLNKWPAIGNNAEQNKTTEDSVGESLGNVDKSKYPLLTGLLNTRSMFDKLIDERNMKVYYNTKRFHVAKDPKQYGKKRKVSGKMQKPTKMNVSELVRAAKRPGCDIVSEVGRGADSGGESGGIDPKLLMYAVVLLRRIDEELPQLALHNSAPSPTPLSSRESTPLPLSSTPPPSPPTLFDITVPRAHPHSLFHYFAATMSSKFVFLEHNIPLLKQCRPCAVVLKREEILERRAGSRVAKKVELPDIEEVRRNNRSMLTAQVAPLAPRREGFVSSPEPPSCSSDSDWTPESEGPRPASASAGPDSARPPPASPRASPAPARESPPAADGEPPAAPPASPPTDEDSADADGSRSSGPTSSDLGKLLTDLLAGSNSGACNHDTSTRLRGPVSSMYAASCPSCAVRVLSSPPISGVEARLQRRLLRRLARPQPTTTTDKTATSTTVTTTTATTGSTATASSNTVAKTKDKSKKRKSKPKSKKRPRSPSPSPPPPAPTSAGAGAPSPAPAPPAAPRPRPRSPVDAEDAAREWLRQKNMAAEKFGVKPRSYKRPAPAAHPHEQLATLQPIEPATSQAQNQTNLTPEDCQMMREASVSPLEDNVTRQNHHLIRITSGNTHYKTNQQSNPVLLNQTAPTILNQANPTQSVTLLNPKTSTPTLLNTSNAPILNNINTPTLFNPNAVADINKKLVKFAPPTEPAFNPIISNVHSLAKPKNPQTSKTIVNFKKVPCDPSVSGSVVKQTNSKMRNKFVIIPAQNRSQSGILVRQQSQESEVAKNNESLFVTPPTPMPQVVNVAGNIHLPSSSVKQGLHLIVSPNTQNNNAMLTNMLNQPNMVVNGNLIQSVQSQQVSVLNSTNFIVTSMPQAVGSQPLLVSCPTLATPTPAPAAPPTVFSSGPGRTSQAPPLLVRSVQAGPSHNVAGPSGAGGTQHNVTQQRVMQQNCVAQHNAETQQNMIQQYVVAQQNAEAQQNVLQQYVVAQQGVPQQNADAQQNVLQQYVVAQQSVPQQNVEAQQNVLQQYVVAQQSVPQQNAEAQQNVLQQYVVAQQSVPQQNAGAQQNVLQQYVVAQQSVPQQNAEAQQNVLQQYVVAQQSVPQQNAETQQNEIQQYVVTPQIATQQNIVPQQIVTQQNFVTLQNVPQQNIVSQQNVVSQQNIVTQPSVIQHTDASQHMRLVTSPVQVSNETGKSGESNKNTESISPSRLGSGLCPMKTTFNWATSGFPSRLWAKGKDSTTLSVLCSGPQHAEGWKLAGFLLVSDEESPPSRAAYWSLRPRFRLLLPSEESPESAKRRKVDAAEGADSSKTWLKVKAFARMVPEEQPEKENQKEETVSAPPRVFVNNLVYQKLSDDPLLYAKLLVAVRDARACRALLARGAALQLYCLRTGVLYPLQAEPKEDVSRITLSGDEEVSSALVSLATQLYKLPDAAKPDKPEKTSERQKRLVAIRKTVEQALDGLTATESECEPRPAKRPLDTNDRPAERPIAPKPPPLPADVIELSDED